MTHADSFVSLSEMVNEYLDSLWKTIRFTGEDADLAKVKQELSEQDSSVEEDPPETWA